MKKVLPIFFSVFIYTMVFSQAPGGIAQPDVWARVIKNTSPATFQYKDFGKGNKSITVGGILTPSLFNFNYSYSYNASSFVSFLSKIESLKEATIFIVSKPAIPTNPTDKQALMNSDWIPSVPTTELNEQSFKFTTTTFNKSGLNLNYPSASGARPPSRINTLIWHSFNSRKIVNSYGANGESNVYVGKTFTGAVNFEGDIPEFIIYRKALNDKEKGRVESYLALKYGITLQPAVNYYNSKNEIFWHKENNAIFGNRIFGLGRDSNTALYQRQSNSADDNDVAKKLTFWTGSFLADNYLNTTYIDDHNFVTIGDNNGNEIPTTVLNNGIKKINRTWLTENFGQSAHNLNTNLKYKADPSITLLPNEAFWLLIDRDANNTAASDFNGANVEVFQVPSITAGYVTYNNLKWATNTTKYNQFTFGVGPKMLITAIPVAMACSALNGIVDFTIKGGLPNFTVNIHGTDNIFNQQFLQSSRNFSQVLPIGSYLVTITDSTGYAQTATFKITPTPEMLLNLGADQQVVSGSTITFNAATSITAPNVTYEWFFLPSIGPASNSPFETTPTVNITVTEAGIYKCIALNNTTNCSIQDEVLITLKPALRKEISSFVYPNPSDGKFTLKINLDETKEVNVFISDVSGKILVEDNFSGFAENLKEYQIKTPGVYFVKITAKDYTTTHKIMIN